MTRSARPRCPECGGFAFSVYGQLRGSGFRTIAAVKECRSCQVVFRPDLPEAVPLSTRTESTLDSEG